VPPVSAPRTAKRTDRSGKEKARTRLEVDERRAQLLALGLEHFSARAYDEVSIDDMAHAAGISKGLVYHYFPTKRHFYVAVIREAARTLLDRTLPDPSAPPLERLRIGIDAYLDYVDQHGAAYVALFRGGIGSDADVARILEETRTKFLERLLEGLPVPSPGPLVRVTLRGWIGFVEATILDWAERREIDRAALRDLLAAVLPEAVQVALRLAGGTNAP
jgi:AcrR family transcriptional regulator